MPRARTPAKPPRAEATRLELLLAAEKLFALHGMMGVSLRQIVAATQQRNLSTVHYHFGSREALAHLSHLYDQIIAVDMPLGRRSLAWHYTTFDTIDDETAERLLEAQ